MYTSAVRATEVARAIPRLGQYVAEVDLNAPQEAAVERTGGGSGHFTVWADPLVLLASVGAGSASLTGESLMSYQLWETRGANLIDSFAQEFEALDFVRQATDDHGPDYLDSWSLAIEDATGNVSLVAEGRSLVDLAAAQTPAQHPELRLAL